MTMPLTEKHNECQMQLDKFLAVATWIDGSTSIERHQGHGINLHLRYRYLPKKHDGRQFVNIGTVGLQSISRLEVHELGYLNECVMTLANNLGMVAEFVGFDPANAWVNYFLRDTK